MSEATPAQVQRSTLASLRSLAQRCAEEEQHLGERSEQERVAIEVQAQRAARRLRERHDRLEHELRQEHQRRSQAIRTRFDAGVARLSGDVDSLRDSTREEAEQHLQKAKKELEHAVWVAESVYDAEQAKLAKQFEETEKRCESFAVGIEKMQREAGLLIRRYKQTYLLHEDEVELTADADLTSDVDGRSAEEVMTQSYQIVESKLNRLRSLSLPPWFTAMQAHLAGLLVLGGVAALSLWRTQWQLNLESGLIIGWAIVIVAAVVFGLSVLSKKQVREAYRPLRTAAVVGRDAAERHVANAAVHRKETLKARKGHRDSAIAEAKQKFQPILQKIGQRRDRRLAQLDERREDRLTELTARRDAGLREADTWLSERLGQLEQRYQRLAKDAERRRDERFATRDERLAAERHDMGLRWQEAWQRVADLEKQYQGGTPSPSVRAVPFGRIAVDARRILGGESQPVPFEGSDQPITLPAMLDLPERGSVLWEFGDGDGRDAAIRGVQATMARLLTTIPPGQVRLTIIDPVGLGQNFAGFMHLADYEEDLVGGRIWTGEDQIEQRLIDLTEHMENVIQKYLRNEFDTIDQYNARAGELAEPYRYLVITDFPVNFSEPAAARLKSIVTSGPRCGVYTLIAADRRQSPPATVELADLARDAIHLVHEGERFIWKDEVLEAFPLELETPPDEQTLTTMLKQVGQGARDSNRVEVPFEGIAPSREEIWSRDSRKSLHASIGRSGATRLQELTIGRDVAQHALLAGKTGSGKSTLLHVMITNLAMWYSPREVEFYLIDFKKGVEFKAYATHRLPHARAVAVESDREFGLSVLQRLDAEVTRRGDLFREKGVQDLAAYRDAVPDAVMPRTLLLIDEFQEFFSEDDKIAQDASLLLDRLVRQGRAFGVHVLLGSQSLGGSANLPRSTIGQMAIRIALQCSEADSQLILGDNNAAARLLSRPGEAIYNDAGGLIEGNSPFQVSWLPDHQRDAYLDELHERAEKEKMTLPPAVVFEGNAPASIEANRALTDLLKQTTEPKKAPMAATVWLGEAVAIKESTAAELRRQSGANLMIIGQQDESAMAIMLTAMLGLAAQYSSDPRHGCRFYLLDGTPADSPQADLLPAVARSLPHQVEVVSWRDVPIAMEQLARESQRRLDSGEADQPAIFTIMHGLQRYRMLRRQEDDFGLSFGSEEDTKPRPDKDFATLLREGSAVGMHTLVWCDSATTLDRTLDRQAMKEFDNRVLFQMSGSDSSNLIDSPAAANLGFYRALFANEERGIIEKFRPYALPDRDWLEKVAANLIARPDDAAALK